MNLVTRSSLFLLAALCCAQTSSDSGDAIILAGSGCSTPSPLLNADAGAPGNGDAFPMLRISEGGKPVGAIALRPASDNVHVIDTCDDSQIYVSAGYTVPQNICASMGAGALNSLYNLAHGGDDLAVAIWHGVKIKSNLTVTVTGPNSSDAARICVGP